MKIIQKFYQLNVWTKIGVIGSIASVVGLIITLFITFDSENKDNFDAQTTSPSMHADYSPNSTAGRDVNIIYNFPKEPPHLKSGKDGHIKRKADYISFNYSRLFGGYQVPFLLAETANLFSAESNCPGTNYLTGSVNSFWNKWQYRDALPLKSRVWKEAVSCDGPSSNIEQYSSFELLKIANENDSVTRSTFYFSSGSYRDLYSNEVIKVTPGSAKDEYEFHSSIKYDDKIKDKIKFNSRNVGFLILYIENIGNVPLTEITFFYKEFIKTKAKFNLIPAYSVQKDIENEKTKRKILPVLKPNTKLLWLLSIYLKNENGYPNEYISSVILPVRISYKLQGGNESISQIVRKPLKDDAFKIEVPFGWYGQ
jgi:hypothetical protein